MTNLPQFHPKNLFFIALGAAVYAFGFVYFNLPNHIAAGGLAGLTMVFHALLGVNPTFTGYLINLPLILLGAYLFGRRSMIYTLWGIFSMYGFVWLFQRLPMIINLHQDALVISLFAGIIAGLGGGLVFRNGGTIGGSDIIARIVEDKTGIHLNQVLLAIDIFVMTISLTYINLNQMMYALIASFMYSQVVKLVENGGYALRGLFIISDRHETISNYIMKELGRGVTYFKAGGAYTKADKEVIYVTLNPTETRELKAYLATIDPQAFVAISSVDEIVSPEFVASKSKYRNHGK
ncbi:MULTISPECIES: YitT family protein [Streptococcus]|uniref:YitT family protein n=1 Tax=Streptococcus caledonicus TaxID=2614158 RepID=A0ABW0U968_9STRE|nr:YitT family protein [Streptococcus sp. S784/96/1]